MNYISLQIAEYFICSLFHLIHYQHNSHLFSLSRRKETSLQEAAVLYDVLSIHNITLPTLLSYTPKQAEF